VIQRLLATMALLFGMSTLVAIRPSRPATEARP
jgi:hypothetical protein